MTYTAPTIRTAADRNPLEAVAMILANRKPSESWKRLKFAAFLLGETEGQKLITKTLAEMEADQ